MHTGYFITGTDTGVGKTVCTLALMAALKDQGLTVAGMKPVSAGCNQTAKGLRNDDAEQLLKASSIPFSYNTINPYAFKPAIAPHIAADQQGVEIQISHIHKQFDVLRAQVDRVIVEGAGGWLVPISSGQSLADVACALQLPVIMVVGMRIGCINHALLTYNHIQASGVNVAGWVANQVDNSMTALDENIHYLTQKIHAPLLATIYYTLAPQPDWALKHLDITRRTF
ncbi:MAG: dethiobiotin synthase [Gammaproteobacteria bacterium]|nr:dethiobiotin synthase [Gammaproteobacteria bacterium]